jgi:hypothetical protein
VGLIYVLTTIFLIILLFVHGLLRPYKLESENIAEYISYIVLITISAIRGSVTYYVDYNNSTGRKIVMVLMLIFILPTLFGLLLLVIYNNSTVRKIISGCFSKTKKLISKKQPKHLKEKLLGEGDSLKLDH